MEIQLIDTHGDIGQRESMEDHFIVGKFNIKNEPTEGRIFGICDGHVGGYIAQLVSDMLPKYMNDMFSGLTINEFEDAPIFSTACKNAFINVDNDIAHKFDDDPYDYKGGTTVCCVVLHGRIGYMVNLGDTRCVMLRDNFTVCAVTVDHRPENEMERLIRANGLILTGLTLRDKLDQNGNFILATHTTHRVVKFSRKTVDKLRENTSICPLFDNDDELYIFLNDGHIILNGHFDNSGQAQQRSARGFAANKLMSNGFGVTRTLGDFSAPTMKKANYQRIHDAMAQTDILSSIPDITQIHIPIGQKVIFFIACDGYWDTFTLEYAITKMQKEIEITGDISIGCAKMMVDDALGHGADDNVSCMIIQLMSNET